MYDILNTFVNMYNDVFVLLKSSFLQTIFLKLPHITYYITKLFPLNTSKNERKTMPWKICCQPYKIVKGTENLLSHFNLSDLRYEAKMGKNLIVGLHFSLII